MKGSLVPTFIICYCYFWMLLAMSWKRRASKNVPADNEAGKTQCCKIRVVRRMATFWWKHFWQFHFRINQTIVRHCQRNIIASYLPFIASSPNKMTSYSHQTFFFLTIFTNPDLILIHFILFHIILLWHSIVHLKVAWRKIIIILRNSLFKKKKMKMEQKMFAHQLYEKQCNDSADSVGIILLYLIAWKKKTKETLSGIHSIQYPDWLLE